MLLIDEAQLMTPAVLSELRTLSSAKFDAVSYTKRDTFIDTIGYTFIDAFGGCASSDTYYIFKWGTFNYYGKAGS